MELLTNNNHLKLLDTLCQLIHKRQFKEAEKVLLDFIQETLEYSKNAVQISDKKAISQTIYYSFNRFYYTWLKENNINIEKERKQLQSVDHTNYLISHSTVIAEMDDLLYELVNYLNSMVHKNEVLYQLQCYKKNISHG